METDRELLELAAKASGFHYNPTIQGEGLWGCFDTDRSQSIYPWNPLWDDGDALRLAVKLGLIVSSGQCWVSKHGPMYGEDVLPYPYVATRRAIVRGAAEIGRSMP